MNLKFWERADPALSFSDWVEMYQLNYGGHTYQLQPAQTLTGNIEPVDQNYAGYVTGLYARNPVIYACMSVRQLLFSEARFQFSQMTQGRRGKLFGTADLQPLEVPWPGGTTGDLLARMIQDADLCGNFFGLRDGPSIRRLHPEWVDIVLAGDAVYAEKIGYRYWPGGRHSGSDPIDYQPERVAHFAPMPDPLASYRGMSWLTPVLREVQSDTAASEHKLKFFDNAATPNMIVKVPEGVRKEAFDSLIATFKSKHESVRNAYKTLFLTSGADATVVGSNMEQIQFKETQGAGETRIAAAAGVPPVVVGLSEGLAAATYSNYLLAMRRLVDLTMRPLWRNAAGSLAQIIQVPGGSELWYDDRDVPALHENARDAAEIDQIRAQTIHTMITSGFQPDSAISVVNPEWSQLQHTGLLSVQLSPMGAVGEGKGSLVGGTAVPSESAPASGNGKSGKP